VPGVILCVLLRRVILRSCTATPGGNKTNKESCAATSGNFSVYVFAISVPSNTGIPNLFTISYHLDTSYCQRVPLS